jgi:DNA-binding IscR family transcriptional regulator
MKISQKGLYALQAMVVRTRHCHQGAIRIRDIAYEGRCRRNLCGVNP